MCRDHPAAAQELDLTGGCGCIPVQLWAFDEPDMAAICTYITHHECYMPVWWWCEDDGKRGTLMHVTLSDSTRHFAATT